MADFGRPMSGPVIASTSSKPSLNSPVWWAVARIENTPMRLPMKLGVSFAYTTPLPSVVVRKVSRPSSTEASVDLAGISSARCM